jgi:AI-2 transport protein TqsA
MESTAETKKTFSVTRLITTTACVVVIIAGLKASASVIAPILLAFYIATVSFPITNWMRQRRLPRFIAVLVTVLVDFILIGGLIVFLSMMIGHLQASWDNVYLPKLNQKIDDFRDTVVTYMVRMGSDEKASEDRVEELMGDEAINSILYGVEIKSWWGVSISVLDFMLGFFGTTLIVVILTIFMLNEARTLSRKMSSLFEAKGGTSFQSVLLACNDIQRYFGMMTLISLTTGFSAYTLCLVLGVDFPELWGFLAFVLNYIPAIGSIVAGIPPVLIALLMQDFQTSLLVAGGYFVINTIIGNFIEPMLMGRRFGISTLVVIVSVIFWGWLWGPIGMLLSVPLTMLLKVTMENSHDFKWLAVAIGKEDRQLNLKATVEDLEPEPKPEAVSELLLSQQDESPSVN